MISGQTANAFASRSGSFSGSRAHSDFARQCKRNAAFPALLRRDAPPAMEHMEHCPEKEAAPRHMLSKSSDEV